MPVPDETVAADPHGAAMLDHLDRDDDGSFHYVRDDGVATPFDIAARFAGPDSFTGTERVGCGWAIGRVLDVGCGSGKHLDAMRSAGLECVGVDDSAVVAQLWARRRLGGVCRADAFRLPFASAAFDTVTLFANGLSMGGSMPGVRRLLSELDRVTGRAGRVVVTNVDVRRSARPTDLTYHAANRAAGRPPGRLVLRGRYRGIDGPPFGWLLLSGAELDEAVAGTGWRVAEIRPGPGGVYGARLQKPA